MKFLWWIEFATKNSQSVLRGRYSGSGTSGGATKRNTGLTDTLTTPSGYITSTNQMRWHYIEDFAGNMMEFADKLVGEEKMRRTKLLGKLQAPDFIMYKLHKIFSANNVIGKSEV